MNVKKSVTRYARTAGALLGATLLTLGLSTDAYAATGQLQWTGSQGVEWTRTNPTSGVCGTFRDTVATYVRNHTDQRVLLYRQFGCSGNYYDLCQSCSTDQTTTYYSYRLYS
ncbi:hypothetical protein [Kitasatospora sp. NPDC005856]|uniref:hypothetical protein n=1 Tax=Kitasatospora sp. NPDC005856 TaxID=3154566 RepID=UPI0033ED9F68